ncbi:S15 peptidase family protein [Mycolicibacterium palauense]|uniref:S15 peptidase family protein n=1 Tax=Mycolicibacterium palauense TaxID=2034511 RepID=UPI001FECBE3B|nr:CocE/NonD family hydrolase [Mycolicibacterium palauense]
MAASVASGERSGGRATNRSKRAVSATVADQSATDAAASGDTDAAASGDTDAAAQSSGDSTPALGETERAVAAEWLANPRMAAGRATEAAATATVVTDAVSEVPVQAEPAAVSGESAGSPTTAPEEAPPVTPSVVAGALIDDVLNPFSGGAPATPGDSPAEWLLLAAARRELGVDAADAATPPVSYAPVITLENSVIRGVNSDGETPPVSENGNPLTYTVVSDPSAGGKVRLDSTTGNFSFLPDLSVVNSQTSEQFSVRVSETTQLVAFLEKVPLVGGLVQPIVFGLQQVPIVNTLLGPLIGYGITSTVDIDLATLAPTGTPVAFTTMMPSFDGTLISVNYFPASDATPGYTAPTILNGPGLGAAGNTDPDSVLTTLDSVPGLVPLRDAGYNVVTWDPRGEFASGGVLQLDSPAFEGQDVKSIIDWVSTLSSTKFESGTDPMLGMVGGSYGGGIQLVTAGIDSRVDAIVPSSAWNTLNASLYTNNAFKTSYSALLLLDLVTTGARINSQIYSGIITGSLLGVLTESQQALLASSGPDFLLSNISAPTLFLQGTADVLFPLEQALTNADSLDATVPTKMVWFCGGHGVCLNPINPLQSDLLISETLDWLDRYVNEDTMVDTGPEFSWFDQDGQYYTSDVSPLDPNFYGPDFGGASAGGFLPIFPLLGGSGPQNQAPLPVSLGLGSEAGNAVNLSVAAPPDASEADPVEVVGAPTLTFTYSGLGTSRHLYAQVVDDQTGLVLGNIVTPVPVTLDGRSHTVTIDLEDIAYTMGPTDSLTVQLAAAATPFLNFTGFGFVNVSDMSVEIPTVGAGANAMSEMPAVPEAQAVLVTA